MGGGLSATSLGFLMNKLLFVLLIFCLWIPRIILSQTGYTWKQVIKESLGSDSLIISVLDYNSESPIDNAKIKLCQNDSLTFFTNGNGQLSLSKTNIKYFEVSRTEYYPLCVALENDSVDNVTILLEKIQDFLGSQKNPKGFPTTVGFINLLMKEGRAKAEEDIANHRLQIYMNIPVNEEQISFGKKYTFAFIQDNEQPIEFRYAYNENVIIYLTNIYGEVFCDDMIKVCWCNSY